ncbi:EEV glycoprotein [Orf virus]|uniref:Protein OPG161 n=1 Tax=Orf virus TaxID=10258 RepID=A0A7U0TJH9_ORFV|nr:EEV glycoprotein [Orf virus]
MAHNTFETDSESANNANYVASVKRQKAIRRYIKLFFRIVAAIAIIVLAILVVLLALELDKCKEQSTHQDYHHTTNKTCDGLFPENKWCLTKFDPFTWSQAKSMCNGIGQTLPSEDIVKRYPWLGKYLTGTWSDKGGVFGSSGSTSEVWSGAREQEKAFFCVAKL